MVEEYEEEREPTLDQLTEEIDLIRGAMESDFWKWLMGVADAQIATRGNFVYNPIESSGEVYKQEFAKGEISGIKLFQLLPLNHLEQLESQKREILQREGLINEENEDGN